MAKSPMKRGAKSANGRRPKAQQPAGVGTNSERERVVQSSVSLRPSQWRRLDVLGDLTRWGRSGTLAQAVDLLTALPVSVTQRLATLSRTTARDTLQDRLRVAVEQAVAEAEAELPNTPWAEFDAALVAAGEDFQRGGVAERSDEELIEAADAAKRAVRRERAAHRSLKHR